MADTPPDKKTLSIAAQMADTFTMEQARLCDAYASDINGSAMCEAVRFLQRALMNRTPRSVAIARQYAETHDGLALIIQEHEEIRKADGHRR